AARAGLLHDIGKAVSGEVDGSHAIIGADILQKNGEKDIIINAVKAHHEEVPFEKKLVCSYNMMLGAVLGEGFHYDDAGMPLVPELILTQEYLQSDELMKRILLSTITNKSYLLSGSYEDYSFYEQKGWEKIVEVIFYMNNNQPLKQDSFLELMISNGERTGRDYLGYMNKEPVRNYLTNKINEKFNIFLKKGLLKEEYKGVVYNGER
ncbi:MAG: HDIG domain-containing protein, partial [Nanoarchaeota archaeon]|nr:HDIG domain-containing protein [Nanoarchaeota archaeon]